MWGYPVFVLGAISSFLEPFRGHLSPKIDTVSEELTLRYPHEEPWVVPRLDVPRRSEGPSIFLLCETFFDGFYQVIA